MPAPAMSAWFGYDLSLDRRIDLIAQSGFRAVSLWWDDVFEPWYGPLEVQADTAGGFGLEVSSAHLPYYSIDALVADDATGDAMEERIRSLAERAAGCGISTLVLHPFGEMAPDHEQIPILAAKLKRIARGMARSGSAIALENLAATPEFLAVFESLRSVENVGLCYDMGHGNIRGGLDRLLLGHPDKVLAIHVHDNDGSADQHRLPFEGTVNWEGQMRLVSGSAGQTPLTLECCSTDCGESPLNYLRRAFASANSLETMRAGARLLED